MVSLGGPFLNFDHNIISREQNIVPAGDTFEFQLDSNGIHNSLEAFLCFDGSLFYGLKCVGKSALLSLRAGDAQESARASSRRVHAALEQTSNSTAEQSENVPACTQIAQLSQLRYPQLVLRTCQNFGSPYLAELSADTACCLMIAGAL